MTRRVKPTTVHHQTTRSKPFAARRGVSLVEVAFSAMLIGVMLVATMNGVGAVFKTRLAARQRQQGDALAHELVIEILQNAYADPQDSSGFGPESGESGTTRAGFDDVDDYNSLADSPPKDKLGTALPNSTGWSRQVTVSRAETASPLQTATVESGVKRIAVTAVSPTGERTTLTAFRCSAGSLEMKPPLDQTYVTGVRASVQVGSEGLAVTGQGFFVNHAEVQ